MSEGGAAQTGSAAFPELDIKDFTSFFAINVKGDFGTLIRLLQDQGNVQVLSSPRLSTINNQKAVLKVGDDQFFVTSVSTSTTFLGNSTQSVPTEDVGLTPFFSGVTLDVTPQISRDGNVILHIHPSVSLVKDQTKEIVLGTLPGATPGSSVQNTLVLPLAKSTIRESDNVVKARNGQVIVIGGLMQNSTIERIAGLPVLSKIPFIGTFFRRTDQESIKSELVILLRPVIVNRCSTLNDLAETDQRFEGIERGFHVGGYPEVFGTEGEREDT